MAKFTGRTTVTGSLLSIGLLVVSGGAVGQDDRESQARTEADRRPASSTEAGARADDREGMSWEAMHEKYISASDLLGGDISNGFNPISQVSDLVLDESSSKIQYILSEVPYPYTVFGGKDGFVVFENVDFRDLGFGDIEIVVQDLDSMQGPEELALTMEEVDQRLASRILGTELHFGEQGAREVEDLLVDRDTGEITHWVVEMDPDAILRSELHAIPADQVSFADERAMTALSFADARDLTELDPAYL